MSISKLYNSKIWILTQLGSHFELSKFSQKVIFSEISLRFRNVHLKKRIVRSLMHCLYTSDIETRQTRRTRNPKPEPETREPENLKFSSFEFKI